MHTRPARLARGALAGSFAVLTAAVSHALAGGHVPSGLSIAVALVFATLLGTAATAARPSLPRLALLVGVSQVAFHLGFVLLGTGTTLAGGHHGAAIDLVGVAASSGAVHVDASGMWIAHAAAALVTLVVLRFAEAATWTVLVRLASRFVLSAFRMPPAPAGPLGAAFARRTPEHLLPILAGRRAASRSLRRGPPALSFA